MNKLILSEISYSILLSFILLIKPGIIHSQIQLDTILSSGLNGFGSSIAVHEDMAVIGAGWENTPYQTKAGAVYIYDFDGQKWNNSQKLLRTDAIYDEIFGFQVATDGNHIIVCAPNSQTAHIYSKVGDEWTIQQILTGDNLPNEKFAISSAIDGNTIAIGCGAVFATYCNAVGSVYIFEYNGSEWIRKQRITPLNGKPHDDFGVSIDIDANTMVVGAHRSDCSLTGEPGYANIFKRQEGTWMEIIRLQAPDGDGSNRFGSSVQIDNNMVLISASAADNKGAVYCYQLDEESWNFKQKVSSNDLAEADNFGMPISVSGNRMLVGAHTDDIENYNQGSAYIFEYNGDQWNQINKLVPSNTFDHMGFGNPVGLNERFAFAVASKGGLKNNIIDAYVFNLEQLENPQTENFNKSFFNAKIIGQDTLCLSTESNYQIEINTNKNHYLDMSDITSGNTIFSPIIFNYKASDIGSEFTYDFYVKPNRAINMVAESNACPGAVTVPLAYSNQNWAVHPSHGGTELGSGVTVGTNGIMVAEHSGNVLVSRLSYTTPISDWTHIAVVYSRNGVELFVNGSLVRSRPAYCTSDIKYPPSAIASALYSPKFQGSIDEFRLWDKALTTAEVADLKDKKLVSEVPNLRYYVSFDNGYYIRALGDLGTDSIAIADDIGVDQLTQSSWDLAPYMGDAITSLVPFTIESLDYLWSTGSRSNTTSLNPVTGVNALTVQGYNEYLTISDTLNVIGEDCGLQTSGTRYLRFRSYYSEDNSQVNVYEIQAYKDGVNVALNKSTYANSHEFGDNDPNAVDGNNGSRWSSNRNDPGPDADNPHFIVVDLLQGYVLDSIILNIEGFDNWEQTFDFAISSDSVNWEIIGSGESTTGIFTYLVDDNLSPDLQYIMSQESVGAGQNIQIPVYVNGFQNILTTQFTITWDPSVVEFQNVQDFGLPFLDAGSFYMVEPGKLTFSWSPDDLQPVSLEDESAIFNIIFTAIGEPGEATDILFADDPTVREVSDAENQVLEAAYNNGQISILDEVTLGGYIKTQKKEPIVGIDVELIGGMEMTATTDETGWYEFKVPPNQEYHIAPLFDTEDDDGVTTLDIVIMHWHILGKKYMMSNMDLIASDVNGSGSLTTLDLAETRSVVLHNEGEKFRGKNSVEFVNNEYTGDADVFEYKNYLDITPTVSHLNLNFTAVKRGDASRSWNPNKNQNGRFENLEEIEILLEKKFITDNSVSIPLRMKEFSGLVGLQFTFEWDPHVYQFSELNDGFLHFESNLSKIKDGKLTVSWNTEELEGLSMNSQDIISYIEFTRLMNGDPKLGINSTITPALAFNNSLRSFRVSSSELSDEIIDSKLTIYPNPAADYLFINFNDFNHLNYAIITAAGSVLMTGELSGVNEINISDLRKGVYILQLRDENQFSINRKFIKR